jgi:CubicO group peptidase (beta-lactamase class C family)
MRRLLVLALVASAVGVAARSSSVPSSQDGRNAALEHRIARIEANLVPGLIVRNGPDRPLTIAARMHFHHTPGVSIAVLNGGVVEWARAYGVAEAGSPGPVTTRTRFQAASISKPVAAMAALRLVQDGRLALDEDVNAKLSSWKVPENDLTKTEKVTLRRLLSHTAGLTVHGFPGYAAADAVPTLPQVLDGVKPANTAPVRVDLLPGREWRYSGGGYTVMQQMLVDVARRPFPALLRETVLLPIRMLDSTYEQPLPEALRGEAATAHDGAGKPIEGRYHTYPEMAAAGLWTTPSDLARFAIEVRRAMSGQSAVLSAAMAKEMLTVQKADYGLGLGINGSGREARFGHGGSNAGFRCQLVAYLESGQGAIVMTNADGGGRLAGEVMRAIAAEYGWPGYPRAREKTVAAVEPAILESYAGRYAMRPGRDVSVVLEAGKLFLLDRSQRIVLLPESATRFFELQENSEIEFLKGPDGAVTGALINGQIKAQRLPGDPGAHSN